MCYQSSQVDLCRIQHRLCAGRLARNRFCLNTPRIICCCGARPADARASTPTDATVSAAAAPHRNCSRPTLRQSERSQAQASSPAPTPSPSHRAVSVIRWSWSGDLGQGDVEGQVRVRRDLWHRTALAVTQLGRHLGRARRRAQPQSRAQGGRSEGLAGGARPAGVSRHAPFILLTPLLLPH